MLDTRSHPLVVHSPERLGHRVNVRPKPSFGLGSLRSRKGLLALTTLLFLAIGLFYAQFRTPTYTASGQLLVYIKQVSTGVDLAVLPGRADLPLVQNQIELLRSGNVLTQVVEALHLTQDPEFSDHHWLASSPAGSASGSPRAADDDAALNTALDIVRRKLSVRQIGTSHMVRVSFKASEPDKAARIVNNVIRIYFQELTRASDSILAKAPELREVFQSLGPSALLISEAEPPVRADGPPAALIVIVAGLLGLGVAATGAILLDVTNDTIRNAQQMEYVLGLECLGVFHRQADIRAIARHAAAQLPRLSERQALRRMTTVLESSSRGPRTIGVTSTVPGEGVTTLAIGLSEAVAALGKRVLLIDGVPENSSTTRWAAKLPQLPSGSDEKPDSRALDGLVRLQIGLHVLSLAGLAKSKNGAMCATLLTDILNSVADSYDLVIVDMPSLAEGPDVRAAADLLDGFLLVVKWGATESELVRQGFRSAGDARPKFIGAVLNMADERIMNLY
jgi:Mrp family chromosome partitioning ATPase